MACCIRWSMLNHSFSPSWVTLTNWCFVWKVIIRYPSCKCFLGRVFVVVLPPCSTQEHIRMGDVHTHGDFIVLPHWETILLHSYPIYAEYHARVATNIHLISYWFDSVGIQTLDLPYGKHTLYQFGHRVRPVWMEWLNNSITPFPFPFVL